MKITMPVLLYDNVRTIHFAINQKPKRFLRLEELSDNGSNRSELIDEVLYRHIVFNCHYGHDRPLSLKNNVLYRETEKKRPYTTYAWGLLKRA